MLFIILCCESFSSNRTNASLMHVVRSYLIARLLKPIAVVCHTLYHPYLFLMASLPLFMPA